jgi:hypothetical protein
MGAPDAGGSNVDEKGWGERFSADRTEHALLPEGEYRFLVIVFERKRLEMGQLGTVPAACLKLRPLNVPAEFCDPNTGLCREVVEVRLPLHRSLEWKIAQFFVCVGLVTPDEASDFLPPWDDVLGSSGAMRLSHRAWKNRAGEPRVSCDVARFLAPSEVTLPADAAPAAPVAPAAPGPGEVPDALPF